MNSELERIKTTFENSLQSVMELLNFDRTILDFAIHSLEDLAEKLKIHHKLDNPTLSAQNTLQALRSIRKNDSMKIQYKRVFNQCLVLLVSHFASTIRDLFETSIDQAINRGLFDKVNKTQVTVSLAELKSDVESRSAGEILSIQKDISFQDMQSIARAFNEYFSLEVPRDRTVNNIIVAQACRHAIVHSGAKVDTKLIRQLSGAQPRSVKPTLTLGEEILFSAEEIEQVGQSMRSYIAGLTKPMARKFGGA